MSDPDTVPVTEIVAPAAIARLLQSPVVRVKVAAAAVPPIVTASVIALLRGASVMIGSSNSFVSGFENVADAAVSTVIAEDTSTVSFELDVVETPVIA